MPVSTAPTEYVLFGFSRHELVEGLTTVKHKVTQDENDVLVWKNEVGTEGFLNSDANLNGQSDNKDKNDIWVPNNGSDSQAQLG